MVEPVVDAEALHHGAHPVLVEGFAGDVGGEGDVFSGGEGGDEVEGLEDEADAFAA